MQEIKVLSYWAEVGTEDNSTFIEVYPKPRMFIDFENKTRRNKK
jgi:hypothetical protein